MSKKPDRAPAPAPQGPVADRIKEMRERKEKAQQIGRKPKR